MEEMSHDEWVTKWLIQILIILRSEQRGIPGFRYRWNRSMQMISALTIIYHFWKFVKVQVQSWAINNFIFLTFTIKWCGYIHSHFTDEGMRFREAKKHTLCHKGLAQMLVDFPLNQKITTIEFKDVRTMLSKLLTWQVKKQRSGEEN